MAEQEAPKNPTGGGPGVAKGAVPAAKPKAAPAPGQKHLVLSIFPELHMPEVLEEIELVTGPNGRQIKKTLVKQKMLRWANHRLFVTDKQLQYLRENEAYGRDFIAAGELKRKLKSNNRGDRKSAEKKLEEIATRSVLGGVKPPVSLTELLTEVLEVPAMEPLPVQEVPV